MKECSSSQTEEVLEFPNAIIFTFITVIRYNTAVVKLPQ